MSIKRRLARLETRLGADGTTRETFTLPGVRITLLSNGAALAVHDGAIVTADFVSALLKEEFPHVTAAIILPDNHRDKPLQEALHFMGEEEDAEGQ